MKSWVHLKNRFVRGNSFTGHRGEAVGEFMNRAVARMLVKEEEEKRSKKGEGK